MCWSRRLLRTGRVNKYSGMAKWNTRECQVLKRVGEGEGEKRKAERGRRKEEGGRCK